MFWPETYPGFESGIFVSLPEIPFVSGEPIEACETCGVFLVAP